MVVRPRVGFALHVVGGSFLGSVRVNNSRTVDEGIAFEFCYVSEGVDLPDIEVGGVEDGLGFAAIRKERSGDAPEMPSRRFP